MRRIAPILILFVIYLVCSSRSCSDDGTPVAERDNARDLQNLIIRQFEADRPSELNLRMLEEAAVRKLKDWADYAAIMTDTSIAPAFREKAGDLARSQFLYEKEALAAELALITSGTGKPDSIRTGRELILTGDDFYSGSLDFYIEKTAGPGTENRSVPVTIGICATRAEKVFGDDTLRLWDVFLGELTREN